MALSFEDEVRAYLHHKIEQDPTANALLEGRITIDRIGVQEALEMQARLGRVHTELLIRTAKEIDKLRAATDGG